ncbi:hypothetical protein BDZ45DRAFT_667706 [Acephala macrosclerotiorum]|nr:hypothetical protein BDZ45DRAFT_667706 [Acephala macrosclerotiorum]
MPLLSLYGVFLPILQAKGVSCCKSYEIAEKPMEIWPVVRFFHAIYGTRRMHGIADAVLWRMLSSFKRERIAPRWMDPSRNHRASTFHSCV